MSQTKQLSGSLPPVWRRVAVIGLYALVSWIFIAAIGVGLESEACGDHTGPCTPSERLLKAILGLTFLGLLACYIKLGWSGRLWGARPARARLPKPSVLDSAWRSIAGKGPWHGAAVIASWIIWPCLFYNAYWLANVFLKTGRLCSIEGCDPPRETLALLLWMTAWLGPPIYLTARWVRCRRMRRSVSGN